MWDRGWWIELANLAAPYFQRAYKDEQSSIRRVIRGREYVVERPNHGLAHSLRQAALATDIVVTLARQKHSRCASLRGMAVWAHDCIRDESRVRLLQLAAAFQRSGRQSEVSSSKDPALYALYEEQDVANFRRVATNYFPKKAVARFARAIRWNTHDDPIARVLHAAHVLDLRRILSFDADRIRSDTARILVGLRCSTAVKSIVDLLWDMSGQYLVETGDRDLVSQRRVSDLFFQHTASSLALAILNSKSP